MLYACGLVILSMSTTIACVGYERPKEKKSIVAENLNPLQENFDVFFEKFQTQNAFQLSRIQFPLPVKSFTEDSEATNLMSKKEWKHTDFKSVKGLKIKKVRNEEKRVDVMLSIEDTGVQVVYHFYAKNGLWWLTYITDQTD